MKGICFTVAALVLAGFPAAASVVEMTFTGTISTGIDNTDTFGTGVTSLNGQSVTMVVTYDTDLGTYTSSANTVQLDGGSAYGAGGPASGQVIINGMTEDIGSSYAGVARVQQTSTGSQTYYQSEDRSSAGGVLMTQDYVVTQCVVPGVSLPLDLTATYTMDFAQCNGYFKLYEFDGTSVTMNASGTAQFTSLSMRVIDMSPVPLQAGFGLLGTALAALGGLRMMRRRGGNLAA